MTSFTNQSLMKKCAIHKSGDIIDPNNYRGICISSCLGKFFTLIMNTRSNHHLEEDRIISKCQIGFRRNCRTADHLLVLKTIIDQFKSKRKPIFSCFVDFKKFRIVFGGMDVSTNYLIWL